MIIKRFPVLFLIILFSSPAHWAEASESQWFTKDSYQTILHANNNEPFLLVLWSIDCPPCHEELQFLGDYVKTHPEFKVVLVSTDSASDLAHINQVITQSQLKQQASWVFSDEPPQQLRYAIDPSWYGELPRSYFLDQCQQRTAISGKLDKGILETMLSKSCH